MRQDPGHGFKKPCFPPATQAQLAGGSSFVWAIACRAAAFDRRGAGAPISSKIHLTSPLKAATGYGVNSNLNLRLLPNALLLRSVAVGF